MSERSVPVDLDNCEDEPIHIPGSIQPHGVLIGVTEDDLRIQVLSENAGRWFGVDDVTELVGHDVSALVGDEIRRQIAGLVPGLWTTRLDEVRLAGRPELVAALHRSGGLLAVEIEHDDSDLSSPLSISRSATLSLNEATTVDATARAAARAMRAMTGFDRVMVYRFDESWNGEVIAEEKLDELNTFLGLHYPSTDIPAQARDLYRRNWIRLIADVEYRPVPLVPGINPTTGEPLDLSGSTIRSVSPIHIEYLRNMGVTASMSVSIIVDNELWGLIACHHYSGPHRPAPAVRNAAEYLGQLVSIRIRETAANDARNRMTELNVLANGLVDALALGHHRSLGDVLLEHESEVMKLASASGVIVRVGGEMVRLGRVPPDWAVNRLVDMDGLGDGDEVVALANIGSAVPELADLADVSAGALMVRLAGGADDVLVWFRPEFVRSVDWAGDPYSKEVASENPTARLSPRKSFDLWREIVRGRSQPWEGAEVSAAHRFARLLADAMLHRDRDLLAVATDLQQVMLPLALPEVAGYRVDAHYVPDGTGRVGGDWYDAFQASPQTLCFVVGDVTGHGLRAASVMAQARNGLRALLVDDSSPTVALQRLNRTFMATMPNELATAAVATLDTAAGIIELVVAGHLPPLLVRSGRSTLLDVPVNPLLGLVDRPYGSLSLEFERGDRLIMFSDGLVESISHDLDRRLEDLRRVAEDLCDEPTAGLSERIGRAMATGARPDDVTVIVLDVE